MKKYILTLVVLSLTLAASAELNSNIDEELKKEVANTIKISAQEQMQKENKTIEGKKEEVHPLLALINEKMELAMKVIDSNVKHTMSTPFTDGFIASQKRQQEAYAQMKKWGVSEQIFEYIKNKFDLEKITPKTTQVSWKFNTETSVKISFWNEDERVIVSYQYNPEEKDTKHIKITESKIKR